MIFEKDKFIFLFLLINTEENLYTLEKEGEQSLC